MKRTIESLIRPSVIRLKPFSSARSEYEGSADVFLDANENPFESSYNRYPDPYQKELKNIIAQQKNVDPSQVFLGNGSDEIIDIIVRCFCEPRRDRIRYMYPSFGMYEVVADINDVRKLPLDLVENFELDLTKSLEDQSEADKIIFLCSPNNPTGNVLKLEHLLFILDHFDGIVVIDEAYADFSSQESVIRLIDDYPNLIVLQTMSKAIGAAGLRIGMAFTSKLIISYLNKIKPPYNIGAVSQSLAIKLLQNGEKIEEEIMLIKSERQRLWETLKNISAVKYVFPSEANFFLVRFQNAKNMLKYLQDKSIVVRDRSKLPGCEECLRITIGKPEENDRLLHALMNYSYAESTFHR